MTLGNVALYVAILALVVYRRVQGRPAGSLKQLFVLPVIIIVVGYEDLARKPLNDIDIAFAVAGCALSLGLGALRGALNKLDVRDGVPWVRWGMASVIVLAVNVAVKLVLDLSSVAAGGTASGATSSLMLAVGLMLVGEAAIVWFRIQGAVARGTSADRSAPYLDTSRPGEGRAQSRPGRDGRR